ncbi:hypothetical protein ACHAW6_001405 [Cyclotella cf. meneghiniana]
MGRVFSTVYRILLMGVSLSAMVLSIITATSCSFLDFVHPYTADGRSLTTEMVDRRKTINRHAGDVVDQRILQNNTESEESHIIQESSPTPSIIGLVSTDYLAQLADSQASNMSFVNSARKNISESFRNDSISVANSSNSNGLSSNTTDFSTTAQGGTVGNTSEMDEINSTDSQVVLEDFAGNTAMPPNLNDENATNLNAVAPTVMKGSTGLFCAPNDDSIYNVWKQTFISSGNTINEETARDESEDLARNGAVVSATFGALVALILVVECMLGWKICCEKWIVSLLALSSSVSQGMTFLFFNSDKYCDANIIHEILEQDPCVVGTGAILSIVALILYLCIIVLVCRAPQDNPYHLLCCCRAQKDLEKRKADSFHSLEMVEDSHSGGELSRTNPEGANLAMSGRNNASAPEWLSDQEENKII